MAGFLIGDSAMIATETSLLELLGAIMFFAGLLIFILAIAHSLWFVAGGKPPRNGAE